MVKKILGLFFVLVLCLMTSVHAMASDTRGFDGRYKHIDDSAEVIPDSQEAKISKKLDEISRKRNMDIAVAVVTQLNDVSIQDYADDLYDKNFNTDGLLLVIDVQGRNWYISTSGYGIKAFTDAGIQYIGQQIRPALSKGNYASAAAEYADLCDDFIAQARKGKPYDTKNLPKEPLSIWWIPGSMLIGFIIAGIAAAYMIKEMRAVGPAPAANDYVRNMHVTDRNDLFLYSTVSRVRKAENESSGGGSSTHTSSSGSTHGGGGGSF